MESLNVAIRMCDGMEGCQMNYEPNRQGVTGLPESPDYEGRQTSRPRLNPFLGGGVGEGIGGPTWCATARPMVVAGFAKRLRQKVIASRKPR